MGILSAVRSAFGIEPLVRTDQILASIPRHEVLRDGHFHRRNFAARDLGDFKCANLTTRTPLKTFLSFVAFDTETTGISLTGNGILEVSGVRFENFAPSSVFSTLIHPKKPIPKESIAVHHITDAMVEHAPQFYEIIPSFEKYIGNSVMVAHNAMFDVQFLFVEGLDAIKNKKVYDTLAISQKQCKKQPNHKLGTCCESHRIELTNAHRSASDALACGLLFVRFLMQNYDCRNIEELRAKVQL